LWKVLGFLGDARVLGFWGKILGFSGDARGFRVLGLIHFF
jgi:hypothetical protein